MNININRLAVDISGDYTSLDDIKAMWAAGIRCIIHKASEGVTIQDKAYADRRKLASGVGMLWAAYHFGRGTPVADQVDNFLNAAQPDNDTGLFLDWEVASMSLNQAEDFLGLVDAKVGRQTGIYSYVSFLDDNLPATPGLNFLNRPLWIAAYPTGVTPPPMPFHGFNDYLFWQYSDGVNGPEPHACGGLTGSVDSDHFNGSEADLRSLWDLWMKSGNTIPAPPAVVLLPGAIPTPESVAARKPVFDVIRQMVLGASLRQRQVDQIDAALNAWVPDGSSRKNIFAVVRDMMPRGIYTQAQVNSLDGVLNTWEKTVGYVKG